MTEEKKEEGKIDKVLNLEELYGYEEEYKQKEKENASWLSSLLEYIKNKKRSMSEEVK